MKTITKIKLLNFFGLFNLARSFYYWLESFNPKILGFYSCLVTKGSLCFDIGANIGRKTDIFLRLGARVIAVEPNPECFNFLRKKYRFNKKVIIIDKALDERENKKELFLCNANALSTMSQEWVEFHKSLGMGEGLDWNRKIEVKTSKLDNLIKEYGQPSYCKIDVEGYELNVLKGLTRLIPSLSFEFSPETIMMAEECIKYLLNLGFKTFNFSQGESPKSFVLKEWQSADLLIKTINNLPYNSRYGEIYSRSY